MPSASPQTMYSKHRIEGLSDGIFAIVMTLLVLDLKVPTGFAPGHLGEALRQDSDLWLAFALTFWISTRYWMLQHNVFALSERFTREAALMTFTFLGLVTILPFSSALVGRHASESLAIVLYCLNQFAIGAALITKLEYLRRREHIPRSRDLTHLRRRLYTLTIAMAAAALCAHFLQAHLRYMLLIPVLALLTGKMLGARDKRRVLKGETSVPQGNATRKTL